MREEQVLTYLKQNCVGRQKAVSSRKLEQTLHINASDLQKIVHKLRRQGLPVCSGQEGYYFAANAGEVYTTLRQLALMRKGLEVAIRGLELSMNSFDQGGASS